MGAAGAGSLLQGVAALMGGKSSSKSTASSDSSSENHSSNVQGSQSTNASSNAAGSANQAYGSLSQAFNPTLGYTATAGNMIGALLGLPQSNFYNNTPAPSVLPTVSGASIPHTGTGSSMIDQLFSNYNKSQAAAPVAITPAPVTTPGIPAPSIGGTSGVHTGSGIIRPQPRVSGGPVQAGQPYVVGERQPELFVPHTSGTIVPQVPSGGMMDNLFGRHGSHGGGTTPPIMAPPTATPPVAATPAWTPPPTPSASNALDTFANSAGQQFVLGEGQRALSGASAANGTFDSGATGKALTQYGQNLGSTYLNDYMNHLFDYAKLGLGSGSALSGAGGVSQSVGSSTGGSSSFGYGNSSGTSDASMDSTSKSKSKQGLGL